jgi:hypothetical protein
MRHLLFSLLALTSLACTSFKDDIATVETYGGRVTPRESAYNFPPMQAVDFAPDRRLLTDDDFADLLPALRRLQPYRLYISGQPISDKSVPLINQIPNLHIVAAEGTDITPDGRRLIKPRGDAIERWFQGRVGD